MQSKSKIRISWDINFQIPVNFAGKYGTNWTVIMTHNILDEDIIRATQYVVFRNNKQRATKNTVTFS